MTLVVLLAHGSPDPRSGQAARGVAGRLGDRLPQGVVRTAFLDHDAPTLTAAVGRAIQDDAHQEVVVVPMFLNNAYHARNDVPAAVAAARIAHGIPITISAPVGPDERLLDALDAALPGHRPAILATAGTGSAEAQRDLRRLAAAWQRRRGELVLVSYASQAAPGTATAITQVNASTRREPVVGTFLLFPGTLCDRIRIHADGRPTSPPLCESDALLDVLEDRVRAALHASERSARRE